MFEQFSHCVFCNTPTLTLPSYVLYYNENTIDSLYKHPSETDFSCHAYIQHHTKSMSVLITKLTCTSNHAMGPKDLVLVLWVCLYRTCVYKASLVYIYLVANMWYLQLTIFCILQLVHAYPSSITCRVVKCPRCQVFINYWYQAAKQSPWQHSLVKYSQHLRRSAA